MTIPPFYDLHNHSLPAVDDGAHDMETALAMLEISYRCGVRTICLTPHYHPALGILSRRAEEAFAELKAAADARFPDLRLLLGSEIFDHSGIIDSIKEGACRPLAGTRVVLLEFPPMAEGHTVRDGIRRLRAGGYTPIIAHIERLRALSRDLTLAKELHDEGALFQINAGTVTGEMGFRGKRLVKKLIRRGLLDLIASDAHNAASRSPEMEKAYLAIARRHGEEIARILFHSLPNALLGENGNRTV